MADQAPDRMTEKGALFDLQRLQEKADKDTTESKASLQEKLKLADLQKEVVRLREKRDRLQEQLKRGPHEILHDYLQKSKGQHSKRSYSNTERKEIIGAVRSLRKRKLVDLCEAYRLTGISVVSQSSKRVCFRCETFFNSQYYEPYYMEIQLKDKLTIYKHTLPYFIPIEVIGELYLNSDLKRFLITVTEYLNAFVSRREQVLLCQEQHRDKIEKALSCSPAYDCVELTTKETEGPETCIAVKLSYDNLKQTLPSSVDLHNQGNGVASQQSLKAKEKFFKNLYLNKAFIEAFN